MIYKPSPSFSSTKQTLCFPHITTPLARSSSLFFSLCLACSNPKRNPCETKTDNPNSFFERFFAYPSSDSKKYTKMSRLFNVCLIASWYSSNIGVLLLNKYLLTNYGFKYPIFLTLCHMMACSLLSYIAISWLKIVPLQTIRSRSQFLKISALGVIFCSSVVTGNVSLRYLPVSFNQAVGATTPFFTAVFAYLLTFRREGWLTYATLIPVVTGCVIASGVRTYFSSFFIFLLSWCMISPNGAEGSIY